MEIQFPLEIIGFVILTALLISIYIQNKFIISQNEIIMTKQERFDAIQARLFAVTNDIAADYKKLLDEVKAGTVSDESLAAAEANISTLEALGASVDNPVPETPEA